MMTMLKQPMIEKLVAMRLLGMIEALKTQEQDPAARELSFSERFGLLVDQQWNWRENQALGRRLKNAKLRMNACVEEIDYRTARGLDKSVIRSLTQESAWVGTPREHFCSGANWRRKKLRSLCFGTEGVSRWLLGTLHSCPNALPRSRNGPRRW
jgi:IstB-like ATP binding protein